MYGWIYCFDAETGAENWSVQHGLSAFDYIMCLEDRLYFTQFNEQLICMDASNGDVIWEWNEFPHTGQLMHAFSPALTHWFDPADNRPVICFRAEQDGGLHAIKDMGDIGEFVWGWGINTTSVYGSPVYNNGVVFFGEGDSIYLLGLAASNGNQVFNAVIDNGPYGHGSYGQAGVAFDKLIVSCIDGVYCFE
jgi:outer membrane protein assembly factor BamB